MNREQGIGGYFYFIIQYSLFLFNILFFDTNKNIQIPVKNFNFK